MLKLKKKMLRKTIESYLRKSQSLNQRQNLIKKGSLLIVFTWEFEIYIEMKEKRLFRRAEESNKVKTNY